MKIFDVTTKDLTQFPLPEGFYSLLVYSNSDDAPYAVFRMENGENFLATPLTKEESEDEDILRRLTEWALEEFARRSPTPPASQMH